MVGDLKEFRTGRAQRQIDENVRELVSAGLTVDGIITALQSRPYTTYKVLFDPKLYRRYEGLARQRAQRIMADYVSNVVHAENTKQGLLTFSAAGFEAPLQPF
jgi:hypothetical protein